jgi:predicted nucleic acid-binding protein
VNTFVLDASVAAKWFLPHEEQALQQEAVRLLQRHARGEIRFAVPDLFWAELGNVFWKATRQARFTESEAQTSLAGLRSWSLPTVPSEALLGLALKLANAYGRTVYDSLYVALAVDTKTELITADEKLANALAAHLPVKWLGAI